MSDIDQVNAMLVEFCFSHGTPLLQFAKVSCPPTSTLSVIAVQSDPPRLATDDARTWARRR